MLIQRLWQQPLTQSVVRKIDTLEGKIARRTLPFQSEAGSLIALYFHSLFESERESACGSLNPLEAMTVDRIKSSIDYLARQGYTFVGPDQLHCLAPRGKYAILTCDDGYYNNVRVLEIAREFAIPILCFVVTHNVLCPESFWWDVVWRERHKRGESLHNISKEIAWLTTQRYVERRDYLIRGFGLRSLDPQGDLDRAFRPGELRQFASNEFVHIGAHTRHHENLQVLDTAAVDAEIRTSIKDIEHLIGYKPATFSYPHGIWNRRVTSLARAAGINFAFTTDGSRNSLPTRQAALTLDRASIKHGEPIDMQCDRLRSKFRVRPAIASLVTKVDDRLYGWRYPAGNQA